jgi:hypothetical protein
MRRSLLPVLMLPVLILLAAPAFSQPQPENPVEEIVVEGRQREKQIHDFIDALTPGTARVPASKFHWKTCPATIGFSDRQNRLVTQRIRAVAIEAGIPLDREDCRPNLLIVAIAGKTALLQTLQAQRPELFETVAAAEKEGLMQSSDPVAAWHLRDWRGLSGESVRAGSQSDERFFGADRLRPPQHRRKGYYENRLVFIQVPSTRIRMQAEPSFASAVVLLELHALDGATTTQIADYAALRAFARTDPKRVAALDTPTMLTLFDDRASGRTAQGRLTSWDLGFLKALYATPNATRGSRQRSLIRKRMRRSQERAE